MRRRAGHAIAKNCRIDGRFHRDKKKTHRRGGVIPQQTSSKSGTADRARPLEMQVPNLGAGGSPECCHQTVARSRSSSSMPRIGSPTWCSGAGNGTGGCRNAGRQRQRRTCCAQGQDDPKTPTVAMRAFSGACHHPRHTGTPRTSWWPFTATSTYR